MNLSDCSGVVVDMDGVLWRGDEPLPGIDAFFELLRARHIPFVLATNNSSKTPANYVDKLASFGIEGVAAGQIITSGTATADYLRHTCAPGTRVHVVGSAGLREILADAGFALAAEDVDVVVVGIDFELTYEKLRVATRLIRSGAKFVGTNPDVTFPSPEGLIPGTGTILAALETSTGVAPTVIGKPGAPMFDVALERLGTVADRTLMIGDRLGTDILGARRARFKTVLVLTGVSTRDELSASGIRPDAVYEGLPQLLEAWESV